MRRILISMLLAGAAASPAWAAPEDYSDRRAERQSARESRQSVREDRQSAREERNSTREESKATREERQTAREQVGVQRATVAGTTQLLQTSQRTRAAQDIRTEQRPAREHSIERSIESQSRGAQLTNEAQAIRDARLGQRQQRMDQSNERLQQIREARRNAPPPVVSNTPQPNTQPPPPTTSRTTSSPQWSSSWRNNSRYNWNHHRRRHRSLFHLGFYSDPFGWGYNPYSIGWRMWPSYYGSSFWLDDPWQYRLPYAPPGTRWIRYYNDAILVDLWSGQVIDVIYSFFW